MRRGAAFFRVTADLVDTSVGGTPAVAPAPPLPCNPGEAWTWRHLSVLGGVSDGLLDVLALLVGDPRVRGGGVVDEEEPGDAPDETHGSGHVEDGLPSEGGDQEAADRHRNGGAQRRR